MGRKNKTKLLKTGSSCTSPGTSSQSEDSGRQSSLSGSFDLGDIKANLRCIVGSGNATEGSRKLEFILSEMEKKSAELEVARKIIRDLQNELHSSPNNSHQVAGDGDYENAELRIKTEENEESVLTLVQLGKFFGPLEAKANDIADGNARLGSKLTSAYDQIECLKEEVSRLESNLEETKDSLNKRSEESMEVESVFQSVNDQLDADLKQANEQIATLKVNVKEYKSMREAATAKLEEEKEKLSNCIKERDGAITDLRQARQESDDLRVQLSTAQNKEKSLTETFLKRETNLKEMFESRINSINSGVRLIKEDFGHLKKDMVEAQAKNEELQLQLTASKADTKHYRDDGTNCRKYIRKLEEDLGTTFHAQIEAEEEVSLLKAKIIEMDKLLASSVQDHHERMKRLEDELFSIKNLFESEIDIETSGSVLGAVVQLKDNYDLEKINQKFDHESLATKNEEIRKLTEELTSSRSLVKKIRKEREAGVKKWKKMFDEVTAEKQVLAGRSRELEEKLSGSSASSDESFRSTSEQNESYQVFCDELRESVALLEKTVKEEKKKADQLSEKLVEVEKINLDLQQTIVANNATIEELEIGKKKTISSMESRITELQRSQESSLKRYNEELTVARQQLESTENALGVQQEMNAKISQEWRQKHSDEVSGLSEKNKQLLEDLKKQTEKLDELRESQIKLIESSKSDIEAVELEKKHVFSQLTQNQKALQSLNDEMLVIEKDLRRVQELERAKTEVLVRATEEEKQVIRKENESLRQQLEKVNQTLAEQKAESKRLFDNEVRKLRKVVKVSEQKKEDALNEASSMSLKLSEIQAETKKVRDEEAEEHERLLSKLTELQGAMQCTSVDSSKLAETTEKLRQERETSESLRTQIMRQDLAIEQLHLSNKLNEQALEEMAQEIERKDEEHARVVQAENDRFMSLQKELENTLVTFDEDSIRQRLLAERQLHYEALRVKYDMGTQEAADRIQSMQDVHSKLESEIEKLQSVLKEKNAELEALKAERSDFEDKITFLSKEVDLLNTKLVKAASPKKDKVIQLENRLEVMQKSVKAQQKRMEDDLNTATEALKAKEVQCEELQKLVADSQSKYRLIEELTESNKVLSEELTKSKDDKESNIRLRDIVSQLEDQNSQLVRENAADRSSLVDELIATKNQLEKIEGNLEMHQKSSHQKIEVLEHQLKNRPVITTQPKPDKIDEMFPSMDPTARQFIRLACANRHFSDPCDYPYDYKFEQYMTLDEHGNPHNKYETEICEGYSQRDTPSIEVDTIRIADIPREGNWQKDVCFRWLFAVLKRIKETLKKGGDSIPMKVANNLELVPEKSDDFAFLDENHSLQSFHLNTCQWAKMSVSLDIEPLGYYKKLSDKTADPDVLPLRLNEDRRLYGELRDELDLTLGGDGFKDEGFGDRLHSLFDYLRKTNEKGSSLRTVIGADFLSNRKILKVIAMSPYPEYYPLNCKSVEIQAIRQKGVIFLMEKEDGSVLCDYPYGYKFEEYMTLDEHGNPHNKYETPSNAEAVKAILRGTLTSGDDSLSVFYSAEADAIDRGNRLIEIKLTGLGHKKWMERLSLLYYLQSHLGNVDRIVIGRKVYQPDCTQNQQLVNRVDTIRTSAIPRDRFKKDWQKDVCFERIFDVLYAIKKTLKKDGDSILMKVANGLELVPEKSDDFAFLDEHLFNHFT
ncbi:unnamed protein product [Caenorhabditis sp. 36 PRJEB53466]|nr:unnamed protein product [Caenorhabditis sp. 36 PRJEB53466]